MKSSVFICLCVAITLTGARRLPGNLQSKTWSDQSAQVPQRTLPIQEKVRSASVQSKTLTPQQKFRLSLVPQTTFALQQPAQLPQRILPLQQELQQPAQLPQRILPLQQELQSAQVPQRTLPLQGKTRSSQVQLKTLPLQQRFRLPLVQQSKSIPLQQELQSAQVPQRTLSVQQELQSAPIQQEILPLQQELQSAPGQQENSGLQQELSSAPAQQEVLPLQQELSSAPVQQENLPLSQELQPQVQQQRDSEGVLSPEFANEGRMPFIEPPPAPAPEPASAANDQEALWGPPQAYSFGYDTQGTVGRSMRQESSDGRKVTGSYLLTGADGINRVVHYVADGDGFRASVITNEPGTEKQNPSGVIMETSQPKAEILAREFGLKSDTKSSASNLAPIPIVAMPQVSIYKPYSCGKAS